MRTRPEAGYGIARHSLGIASWDSARQRHGHAVLGRRGNLRRCGTGQLQGVLGAIDIDWEEQLAAHGDVLAHQLGNAARHAGRWLDHVRLALEQDLSEYLQEELRVVPTRIEIENLIEDIGRLGMDADRLEARLRRLLAARGDA
jgi:hypothetical protein